MLKDLFVLVAGVVQQKGAGQKWFREAKDEEAEFEFVVQNVEMLNETQDKRISGLNVRLALEAVTPELIDEFADKIKENPGQGRLHVTVVNPMNRQQVALTSRSLPIRITPRFYKWLVQKRMEGALEFSVVEKGSEK